MTAALKGTSFRLLPFSDRPLFTGIHRDGPAFIDITLPASLEEIGPWVGD